MCIQIKRALKERPQRLKSGIQCFAGEKRLIHIKRDVYTHQKSSEKKITETEVVHTPFCEQYDNAKGECEKWATYIFHK